MQDVVKSTFYVVGWDPSQFDALVAPAASKARATLRSARSVCPD